MFHVEQMPFGSLPTNPGNLPEVLFPYCVTGRRQVETMSPNAWTNRLQAHSSRSKIPAAALGSSSDSRNTTLSLRFTKQISGSPNSANTCRQAPHGEIGTPVSATTTTASIFLDPAAIAAPTATLSAHMLRPKERFSTLQPVNTLPPASRAAPTWNFE